MIIKEQVRGQDIPRLFDVAGNELMKFLALKRSFEEQYLKILAQFGVGCLPRYEKKAKIPEAFFSYHQNSN